MKIKRIHIGEIIREKVELNGMSKSKFAENLNIARQNIEKTVFQKHSIDTDLLCNICEVLNCNLFNYYTDEDFCNKLDYKIKEVKARITLEMDEEEQGHVVRFVFGNKNIINNK